MLSPGVLCYFGTGGFAGAHSHHAIQVVRSFDAPFEVEQLGSRCVTRTAVIAGGVRHRVSSGAQLHAIVLVEPELQSLQSRHVSACAREIASAVAALPAPTSTPAGIAAFGAGVAAAMGRERMVISEPIHEALASLERQLPGRPRLAEVARAAHLSPSRLTHRFSAELGVPFRRYVLWRRLWRLAREISAGGNLTVAAHAAGFSDSAHCSRVFRSTFGVAASAILTMEISWTGWPERTAATCKSGRESPHRLAQS